MDAVGFTDGVRLLCPTGCFCPIIEGYGTDVDTYAVSYANVPVHSYVGSVDTQFVGFGCPPDFVAIVFAYNLTFGLKIRINRQKFHHSSSSGAEILGFLLTC